MYEEFSVKRIADVGIYADDMGNSLIQMYEQYLIVGIALIQ